MRNVSIGKQRESSRLLFTRNRCATAWGLAIALLASWTPAASAAFPSISLQALSQNEIVSPVAITNAGDGSNRLFVADQRGTVHVIDGGVVQSQPLLDIESKLVSERPGFDERGLLGLAFHPDFGASGTFGAGKFYIYYSAPDPASPGTVENPIDHHSVIAEYQIDPANPNLADPLSERVLLTIQEPQFNHNGGSLNFGPDGMLYITTGDGGSSNDNNAGHTGGDASRPSGGLGNAQDLTKLLGKALRIDVAGTNGPGGQYGIPSDNPFVGNSAARGEIYAYGLRNPWRATFDGDRFIVADVGQRLVEEVNLVNAGDNLGWRIREGNIAFDDTVTPVPPATLVEPIAVYAHPLAGLGIPEVGLSITGGVVYRGSQFPELVGKYLFGDWSTEFGAPNGTLLGLEESTPGAFEFSRLDVVGGNPIGEYILAFGLDEQGEAYVATKRQPAPSGRDSNGQPTGSIYRITVVPEPTSVLLLTALLAAIWTGSRNRGA